MSVEKEYGIPHIDKDLLVDYAGWEVWRAGVALAGQGAVQEYLKEAGSLKGKVSAGGRWVYPKIYWKNRKLEDFQCQCLPAQRGEFCTHLTALLVAAGKESEENTPEGEEKEVREEPPELKGMRISRQKGIPLRLHIKIAPNWKETLPQNKVMVMLEVELVDTQERFILDQLDRGRAYHIGPSAVWVLRWIETWCQGKFYGILQLNQKRLAVLAEKRIEQEEITWSFADGTPILLTNPFWAQITGKTGKAEISSSFRSGFHQSHSMQSDSIRDSLAEKEEVREVNEKPQTEIEGSQNYLSLKFTPLTSEWRTWAKEEGMQWEPSNQRFWLRKKEEVIPFLSRHWSYLKEQTLLEEAAHFQSVFGRVRTARVIAEVIQDRSGGQIGFYAMDSEGNKISNEIDWDRGTLRLSKGEELQWILENTSFDRARRIRDGLGLSRGMNISVRENEEAYWMREFTQEGIILNASQEWKERAEGLLNFSKLAPPHLPEFLEKTLRLYQKIGVAWLLHLFRQGLSGILADEMGLGKTVQAIAVLESYRLEPEFPVFPSLIVCPASLVENWIREVRRFAPLIRIGDLRKEGLSSGDSRLWIGSYHRIARMQEELRAFPFGLVIADEAQHVKNESTKNAKALRSLKSERRLMLTGTPLENHYEDLVSLFRFLIPGYLNPPGKGFSAVERKEWLSRVPAKVAPYILRRTKMQVLQELPERLDQTLFIGMTDRQQKLYSRIEDQAKQGLNEWRKGMTSPQESVRMLSLLTRLRQASVEPRVLEKSWKQEDSAKVMQFIEIVEEARSSGSRLLVFSQFVSVLEIWRRDLSERGVPSCFLHGGVRDRMQEVDRFQNNPDIPLFFLSLKVGGVGLNLTGADRVVIVDPWWNPAIEEQAVARAHRMGQKRSVHSIKLISSETIEEKVLSLQQEKQRRLEALWDQAGQQEGSQTLMERISELF